MARTAYVFIHLPGETTPVVAGRFDLQDEVTPHVGEFVYAQSYLGNENALPLDPIALPLREQLFTTTLSSGFFGVFRDAIPDGWGKHVAARLGDTPRTDFDFLFLRSDDRIGALTFGPTPEKPVETMPMLKWEDLRQPALLDAIGKLDRDMPLNRAERRAAMAFGVGTSAGGARPKVTVQKDGRIWLAKLKRNGDPWNVMRVEAAMLDLAAACGIEVPEHRVERAHRQDLLLVERFDRIALPNGIGRHRMVSAATVFLADAAMARWTFTGSYPRFALELTRWTITGDDDRRALFRRIAFNALCSITDDHERNHALVANGAHFRLSPAFDLAPPVPTTRRRLLSLNVGGTGAEATRANLLSSVEAFGLTPAAGNAIVDEVKDGVARGWRRCCKARDVSAKDVGKIAECFVPEFFEAG